MKDLLQLALQGVKQKSKLTTLMVFNLVMGIALLLTMSTIISLGGSNPIAHKGDRVYNFSLNFLDADFDRRTNFRYPPLTFQDAAQLTNAELNVKYMSMNFDTQFIIESRNISDIRPILATASATDLDYFNILQVPFIYGSPWQPSQSQRDIIVIDKKVNDQLFASENSVGQHVRVNKQLLEIVGVMDLSRYKRRFQNMRFSNRYNDLAVVPFALAERLNLRRAGIVPCQAKEQSQRSAYREQNLAGLKSAECGYLNTWVEFDETQHDEQLNQMTQWARSYSTKQQELGRFPHQDKFKLSSLNALTEEIQGFMRWEQVYLQFSYLLFAICLVNTIGILLAKYQAKTKLVSLYRALGASRGYVVKIHIIEVSIIAVLAIGAGLLFAHLGLELMYQVNMYQLDYSADPAMVKTLYSMDYGFALSMSGIIYGAILIAGLYPVYRVSGVSPASQLRG